MSINANILPPAAPAPERASLQSADLDIRTCEHEIAAALESFARKAEIPLFGTTIEFERAAASVVALIGQAGRCPLKGAS